MKFSGIILLTFILISCSGEHHHEDHSHAENNAAVSLNNGSKWKANQATIDAIDKMILLTEDCIQEHNSDIGNELNAVMQELVEKCTMEGEAHEQLHNFIVPVNKHILTLKEDPEDEEVLHDLLTHLESFHEYFE